MNPDIDRPVGRIRLYHRIGDAMLWPLFGSLVGVLVVGAGWALSGGAPPWNSIMVGAYVFALVCYAVVCAAGARARALSDGACHNCGGVIEGGPGEDWVLACRDCGREWVYGGEYEVSA